MLHTITLRRLLRCIPALFLTLFALQSQLAAQPPNQIQQWSGSQWVNYDPPGSGDTTHPVDGSDIIDTRSTNNGDWFQWKNDNKTYRIKKDKIESEKMRDSFQKAADEDVNVKIVMDKDGKFKRIELRDKD